MKRFLIALTILTVCSVPAWSFSLNVDKPGINITSAAGTVQDGFIEVRNTGRETLRVKAYVSDWKISDDGSKVFFPPGTLDNSCAKWLHVYPEEFSLAPGKREKINYVLTIPEDASGGHYAVVFFETAGELRGSDIQFSGRIGSIIYHTTQGSAAVQASLKKASFNSFADGINTSFEFTNLGNVYLKVKPTLAILDRGGKVKLRKKLKTFGVMPGQQLLISEFLEDVIEPGDYSGLITAEYGKDEFSVIEQPFSVAQTNKTLSSKNSEILIIEKFSPVVTRDTLKAFVKVRNKGSAYLNIDADLQISDGYEEPVMNIELEKNAQLAPSGEKLFYKKLSHELPAGEYNAKVTLTDGTTVVSEEHIFVIR